MGIERALSEHSEVAVAGKVNGKSQANVKLNLLPLTIDTVDDFEKKYPNGVPAYNFKEHSKTYNANAPFAVFELSY